MTLHRTAAPAVALLLLSAGTLGGLAAGADDPAALIGMDPPALFAALGAPVQVQLWRGEAPDQDNVIFFYPDFRSVFWFQNRVWQVRFDRRYRGAVFGFRPGMERFQAEIMAAGLLLASGDSLYLTIDTYRYPLRLRLVFEENRLADIYLYRSDY